MRSRRCLRMILHPKDGQRPVPKPLDAPVVEIYVGDLQVARTLHISVIAFNREAVILRSDEDATRLDFLYGMISAAVAIGHLRGRPSECQTDKLVAEADTEGGDSSRDKRAK